jgi:hyperosmotically inducible protein
MQGKRLHGWNLAVLSLATVALLAFSASPAAAKPDAWITTKAKIALLADDNVHGTAINVDTIDGRVTLHGNVATAAEKTAAEKVVRGIEGVKDVNNMLKVAPRQDAKSDRSDDELRRAVDDALAKDRALTGANVHVSAVKDGIVTLDGNVPTMSAHARALQTAFHVPGVAGVRSDIDAPDVLTDAEIFGNTATARGPNGNERTGVNTDGGNIKGDQRAEGTPPAAKESQPSAKSDTRTGAVASSDREPDNSATGTVQDMWITTATKLRLIGNDQTPALDINVDTMNGEVTLFGMVPTEAARTAAENEAKAVDGVVRVKNELEVVPSKKQEQVEAADSELKTAIEKNCDAETELDDDDIDVAVSNGVARLTGTVDSGADRMAALTCARAVPGVRSAIDDLHIERDTNASLSRDSSAHASR